MPRYTFTGAANHLMDKQQHPDGLTTVEASSEDEARKAAMYKRWGRPTKDWHKNWGRGLTLVSVKEISGDTNTYAPSTL
jgi:hypothetical protein